MSHSPTTTSVPNYHEVNWPWTDKGVGWWIVLGTIETAAVIGSAWWAYIQDHEFGIWGAAVGLFATIAVNLAYGSSVHSTITADQDGLRTSNIWERHVFGYAAIRSATRARYRERGSGGGRYNYTDAVTPDGREIARVWMVIKPDMMSFAGEGVLVEFTDGAQPIMVVAKDTAALEAALQGAIARRRAEGIPDHSSTPMTAHGLAERKRYREQGRMKIWIWVALIALALVPILNILGDRFFRDPRETPSIHRP